MRRLLAGAFLGGLACLGTSKGHAQLSDAQLAQAGKLLAQCAQLTAQADDAVRHACTALSKAVVNGRDPAASLPTVDQILPGDIHVFGPWSASIVLRKKQDGTIGSYAVIASATGSDIVVTRVGSAADAAALMKGAVTATTVTVVTTEGGAQAAAGPVTLPAGVTQGWVTEVRPTLVTDGSLLSEDVLARYVGTDPAQLSMGDYLDALPARALFSQVAYVRSGLFIASEAGQYRFSVSFQQPERNAVAKWECWPHLAFLDGTRRQSVLPSGPIIVDPAVPADRIPPLVSSPVTLPAGLAALELTAQCAIKYPWNPGVVGQYLRSRGFGRQGSPWPTLLLQVQRPTDPAPSPVRVDEIVYDAKANPGLRTAPALRELAERIGTHDALAELTLPPSFHRGWYIDTYPILGGDTAWSLPPTGAIQATFYAAAGGFTLADHLRQPGVGRDGKIYIANSEFLALADGRYSFMVVADNPRAPALSAYGYCTVELLVTDRDGNVFKVIQAAASNTLLYWTGANAVAVPAFGGATLGRGAFKLALRAACMASQDADITTDPLAQTRFSIFVREPDAPVLHPPNPGVLVYRSG